jgi:proteasome lid subunit RPN8/RPN11
LAVAISIRREHLDAMIAHALEDAPIECCGLLAKKDGVVVEVYRARNAAASPYRFDFDPRDNLRINRELDDKGQEIAGTYHSHTGSDPVVSPTDIRLMGPLFGPPYVHFVIGVADRANPIARCWYIEGGDKSEQEFEILP